MGVVDRCAQTLEHTDDFLIRELPGRVFQLLQARFQRGAIDEFHDHVVEIVFHIEIEHLDDVRVPQGGHRAGLTFEPANEVRFVSQIGVEDFDRDETFQPGLVAFVDLSHTTPSQSFL